MTLEQLQTEGWRKITSGGFTGVVGPFWMIDRGDERTVGMLVEPRHTNEHLGTLHGGVVMTFADIALGTGVVKAMGEKAYGCATLSLQTQFVSVARVGDFITCTPELVRHSKQIIFVRGLIRVGDKNIASVEGMWKLLDSASS